MSEATRLYLDRFESDTAVLIHAGGELNIPRGLLPAEAREGDYLHLDLTIDQKARLAAAEEISELQKRLKSRDPGQR